MGDGRFTSNDTAPPTPVGDLNTPLIHQLAQSNAGDSTGTKVGRVGEVILKGFGDSPTGVGHAVENFVKPENWGKDALMIGSSALFGAALRVALPESGALKTAAGVVMGVMFAKDALMPIVNAGGKVWNDGSSKTMSEAARNMGDGLGDFAVQGGISVLAAGAAAKMTPWAAQKVSPTGWSSLETWKANHLGGASSITLGESALAGKPAVSRAAAVPLELSKPGVKIDLSTARPEVVTRISQPAVTDAAKLTIKDLAPDQLKSILQQHEMSETTRLASGNLGRFGLKGSDGNFHSHDDVVSLLLKGKDPSMEAAGSILTAKTVPLSEVDLTKPNSIVITAETADAAARRGGRGGRPQPPSDGDGTAKPADTPPKSTEATAKPGDTKGKPTDTTAGALETGKVTDASRLLNAKNMLAQAAAIKNSLTLISDQDGLIMDAMNRNLGAIDVRTNPHARPLTGYDVARKAAFDLAEQVGTDPGSFQQVNGLYDRFAAGALQSGTMDSSDIAAHVARMDLYAKENFETYRQNIIDAGIDPDVALAQKPAPPLVEGTSDVQRVGTDQNGDPVYSHEGPHTLRSIYGPNGEAVWPLDMVKTPIREIGMRGVNTSGIYGHEFEHDQFGQMGKFDPAVRDAKLDAAAAKAWGADADKMVDIPNGGKDPQQVLLDSVVRKMAKVEPADHDAFLTEQLGLDPQSRVMRGAQAADTLLGPAGKSVVQVPGSGPMPLEVFVGNIAAMADARTPTDVLAEMQGKGTPAATEQAVSANVDKMLGANGQHMIPLADGTQLSLKDVVLKVSDATRNPKFDTYDKPLPAQMSNAQILKSVAMAWADETFADWGAASESGQTAAPYFQALSKDGLLRGGTVTGQEMRGPDNELGIEAHPTDKLRPRYQAALIRALATAKGQHDQVLLDHADALEQYSRDAAKAGPIMLPTMDSPGQAIQIPEEIFDKFIPALVDAQLNTPLPRLQGKTLFDILPDLRKNFRINDAMADTWATAIQAGKGPESLAFDAAGNKITHVYGAGQPAFLRLVTAGMDPVKANDAVNTFSDFFGDKIVRDRAAAAEAPATPASLASAHPVKFAAMARGGANSTLDNAFGLDQKLDLTPVVGADGSFDASAAASSTSSFGQRLGRAVTGPTAIAAIGGATAAYKVQDLLGLHKVQQDVLKQNQ
jgi:hypothetical protein